MAFNLPSLPSTGDVASVTNWAQPVRDSLSYLKGQAGAITFENGIIVTGQILGSDAAGPAVVGNEAATTTNPTLCPNKAELDTGIGWASDVLHFILGGTSYANLSTTALKLSGGIATGGVTPLGRIQNYIGGDFASDGSGTESQKQYYGGTLTGHANDVVWVTGSVFTNSITLSADTAVSSQAYFAAPQIDGAFTATVGATVYIAGAPTGAATKTTNAAIYVASGDTNIDTLTTRGNINVAGTVDGRDVATDGSKLDGIEALADVTDATNVNAAGATMNADTSLSGNAWFLDEDTMSSNDDTKVPSQQSVKAYVDNTTQASGGVIIHGSGYHASLTRIEWWPSNGYTDGTQAQWNGFPAYQLADGAVKKGYYSFMAPQGMLSGQSTIYLAWAGAATTGQLYFGCTSRYSEEGEPFPVHSETISGVTVTKGSSKIILTELPAIIPDISALRTDMISLEITRDATGALDTISSDVYFLGLYNLYTENQ